MADTDSENEGILNNIQRLVIRPPGHTGKAKKGHICFDGGHETMNLGRVDFITNQEYDLFIRPDTANPRARLWFHFTVENTQVCGELFTLHLKKRKKCPIHDKITNFLHIFGWIMLVLILDSFFYFNSNLQTKLSTHSPEQFPFSAKCSRE